MNNFTVHIKTAKKSNNKSDGDMHITQKLRNDQHKESPNEVTEGQLGDCHFDITEVITEKQLEKSRTGFADTVIEKNLNDSQGLFGSAHRNDDTYLGDINKIEEQRISGDTMEDEKYEIASGTPKELRWWEMKSPDGHKIASLTKKKIVNAQADPVLLVEDSEGDELDDEIDPVEEKTFEEASSFMTIKEDTIDEDGGRTIVVEFPLEKTKKDEYYITHVAKERIESEFPDLEITTDDFSIPEYGEQTGTVEIYIPEYSESSPSSVPNMDIQEGTITSASYNYDFPVVYAKSEKAEAAFQAFAQGFDEDNLERSNGLLTEILNDSFLSPRETVVFKSKARRLLSQKGIYLDNL